MKSLQNLAAPNSFSMNKQEMCWPMIRELTRKCSSVVYSSGYKLNSNHNNTSRSHLKFNKRIYSNVSTTPLINNKDTTLHFDRTSRNIADIFNGRSLRDGLLFQQNFLIRSYELGSDCKVSIASLISLLQESALNHFKSAGLVAEGFGSTPEMSKRDLIWVVYKLKIDVDFYPTWGDVVQVDTWTSEWGKNGMQRDWLVRDHDTRKVLFRATSVYVMMNKKTRKLSKFIEEAREEIKPVFIECNPITNDDGTKLKLLDIDSSNFVRNGLSPQWTDLDVNQHVSNVKYVDWVLEGVPESVVETHKLSGMRLEFRKECGKNNSLQSLSAFVTSQEGLVIELDHTIRLQNGSEILRGRTTWSPRN